MKKILTTIQLILPLFVSASVITSTTTGGQWGVGSTWIGGIVPAITDTAIIAGHVTLNYASEIGRITINSGKTISIPSGLTLAVTGEIINNGDADGNNGDGHLVLMGTNQTVMSGPGTWEVSTFFWSSNQTIASNVHLTSLTNLTLDTQDAFSYLGKTYVSVINLGYVNMDTHNIVNSGTYPCAWTNGTNSTLKLSGTASLTDPNDTLNASASGNLIEFSGLSASTIKRPSNGTFYNLYFYNNFTKTLPSSLTVHSFILEGTNAAVNMASHTVTVGGNWTNNSTVAPLNMGTVIFNGTSAQTLGGTMHTRFTNVTVSGSGNVNIATSTAFTGVLTLSGTGNLTSSGGIYDTLLSTSSATARVAPITGTGTITANFVVQRYDGRTAAQYQTLATPVQSTTLGDWNESNRSPKFYMSGVGGPDGEASDYVSVYLYDEATNTYNPITNYSNPGINYTLVPGQGVYLWVGQTLSLMSPFTYITHGVPNTGNISYNVTFTNGQGNGFNIIGNPYPSPIDWNSFTANNPTVQTTYYLFEQDGSWHTFTSGSIPMEQGFGIITSSSATLAFKETQKTATDAALQKVGNTENQRNAVTFTLSDDANSYSCPTIISFGENYASQYSLTEDALFIKSFINDVPELYTASSDQKNLALNRLPANNSEVDVPLTVVGNVAANYTLTADNLYNVTAYNCVCLIDKTTGSVLNNFEDNPSYTFAMQAGQEKDFIVRFKTLAAGEGCNTVNSVVALNNNLGNTQIYHSFNGASVAFHLNQPENATISVYNMVGEKMVKDINLIASQNTVQINLPATGQLYVIRVVTANGITVKKLYY